MDFPGRNGRRAHTVTGSLHYDVVVLGVGVALLAASVCAPALNRVRAEPLAAE